MTDVKLSPTREMDRILHILENGGNVRHYYTQGLIIVHPEDPNADKIACSRETFNALTGAGLIERIASDRTPDEGQPQSYRYNLHQMPTHKQKTPELHSPH